MKHSVLTMARPAKVGRHREVSTVATFQYEAMNSAGQEVKADIEANSADEAIAKIRTQGYFPTKVKEKVAKKSKAAAAAGGNARAALVATLFLRVGSRFEAAADNGISHFLEHMVFRGTRSLDTAHALASDREKAMEVGCDGYLAKPCEPRAVVAEVQRFLGKDAAQNAG